MNNFRSIFWAVTGIWGTLVACSSTPVNPTEISQTQVPTKEPSIQRVEGEQKARLFNEVIARQTELGLCEDAENLEQNLEQADIFIRNETHYLVQVLCFNAAYQGNYEFVYLDTASTPTQMQRADFYLAGYPSLDVESGILSNTYKFNGAGTCVETSSYYWNGDTLKLVSSRLVDGIANGCEEMGVGSPTAETLITATGVGMAELGMTLGELRQKLPEQSRLEPTVLGVDLPAGLQVSLYGEAQFSLGFDTNEPEEITDESKIQMIVVESPRYRTEAGVGVGTPVEDAIAPYGTATLGYNQEAESREWIDFANEPFSETSESRVLFRSNQWTVTDFAGIYPDSQDSYQQTQEYHDHAAVGSIWLLKTQQSSY